MRATYGARLATLLDLRGLALIDAGEHAAAVPLYDEAITLKDDDRGLWLHRALARVGLGEHPAALRDLDECVARGGEGGDASVRAATEGRLEAPTTPPADTPAPADES